MQNNLLGACKHSGEVIAKRGLSPLEESGNRDKGRNWESLKFFGPPSVQSRGGNLFPTMNNTKQGLRISIRKVGLVNLVFERGAK